jgi:hypothetical protein
VAGDRIVIGTDDAFSLRVYDGEGRLLRLVRQDRPTRPASAEYYEQYMASQRERMEARPAGVREQMEIAIEQIPRHETLPAFGLLHLDRTGHLWVQEYVELGEPRTDWQIFDPDGVLVARVRIPDRLDILDIGSDYLLGRDRDEFGVERVRMYELTRGGG